MSSIKMRIVSKTMNCIVSRNTEDGQLDMIPESLVDGTEMKEVRKIDGTSIPITILNEIREANMAKFRLKLSVKKPKEGDRIVCDVQYLVKDE